MSFAMLNAITDPKENVNASPDISGLLWSILVFRNFPSKYEVVHINVPTSFSSWKDSFWVSESHWGTITFCSKNISQLDGKRIMSALKDFTAVLQNKPGNAHYRYWKQKSLLFCLLLDKW